MESKKKVKKAVVKSEGWEQDVRSQLKKGSEVLDRIMEEMDFGSIKSNDLVKLREFLTSSIDTMIKNIRDEKPEVEKEVDPPPATKEVGKE